MPRFAKTLSAIQLISGVLFPVWIAIGLKFLPPGMFALMLAVFFAIRSLMLILNKKADASARKMTLYLIFGCLALLGYFYNKDIYILFYPVLVNLFLFGYFFYSLMVPPTAIQKFAQLKKSVLEDWEIAYTRKVTKVWCCFFVFNGGISLWTVFSDSHKIWLAYNGCISYGFIGALFFTEWMVRRSVIKKHLPLSSVS